jgi:hypothetical protein
MRIRDIAVVAGLALFASGTATVANAGEKEGAAKSSPRVIVLGESGAKFEVVQDQSAGKMTFKLVDSNVKLANAPTVTIHTSEGPQDVTLVPLTGQPNTWVLTNAIARRETFDGTFAIVVDGKSYTTPIFVTEGSRSKEAAIAALHGGRIVMFPECKQYVEVLHDPATGTFTLYSSPDYVVAEAPVLTLTQAKVSEPIILTKVEGQNGVWMIKNDTLKTQQVLGTVKLMIDGSACTTTLRGGNVYEVADGPRWEVIPQPNNAYRFYVLDEQVGEKPVVIEKPTYVVGDRTYELRPVRGEPRAYDLVGLEAGAQHGDGMLRFTLFGKSLETRVGLHGVGVGVR